MSHLALELLIDLVQPISGVSDLEYESESADALAMTEMALARVCRSLIPHRRVPVSL